MNISTELSDADIDILSVTFPGGLLPSAEDVVGSGMKLASMYVGYVRHMRYEAAISGAMRWPWSQEAAIEGPSAPKYK